MMRNVIRSPLEQAHQGENTLLSGPARLLQGGKEDLPPRQAGAIPPSPATILQRLQTTLELEPLIRIFSESLNGLVPHDGIALDCPEQGIHISHGRISRHTCSYNLMVEQIPLGELRILRGRRFRPAELRALEEALTVLVYPLRNALLYHQALQSAQTDPLTGLLNRAALDRLLERELAMARRSGGHVCLLVLDVDHFKEVNDRFGHQTGDQVLLAVSDRLQDLTRKSDMVFRYGGEEFVLIMGDTDPRAADQGARRIHEAIRSQPLETAPGESVEITVSIGIACVGRDEAAESLFRRADQAMYRAKHTGRDRIVWSDSPCNTPAAPGETMDR
ncbi:MAG: GGDEF domain-containing protein [Ectothiorhodospira sp.]